MALEYELVLASDMPASQVTERAFPEAAVRPTGDGPVLSADLFEQCGFTVTVRAGRNGYVEAVLDEGTWAWEPETYVSVTFRLDKFADDRAWQMRNMLAVVRRVLDSGPEDAVLEFNGDTMILARLGGLLVKHRRSWWDAYDGADAVLPG